MGSRSPERPGACVTCATHPEAGWTRSGRVGVRPAGCGFCNKGLVCGCRTTARVTPRRHNPCSYIAPAPRLVVFRVSAGGAADHFAVLPGGAGGRRARRWGWCPMSGRMGLMAGGVLAMGVSWRARPRGPAGLAWSGPLAAAATVRHAASSASVPGGRSAVQSYVLKKDLWPNHGLFADVTALLPDRGRPYGPERRWHSSGAPHRSVQCNCPTQ